MPARKREYTQDDIGTWAADSPGIRVAIERNGILTDLQMTSEITPSGAGFDGANMPDGLFRTFQNVTISGGASTYITHPAEDTCPAGIMHHYSNRLDFRMAGHPMALVTAPRRAYTPITHRWHFGSRPETIYGIDNPFDLSAFIPGNKEASLNCTIVTSGNDVMDDTVTISSGTYRFQLSIIQGSDAEIWEEVAAQGVQYPQGAPTGMVPAWTAEVFSHTATKTAYSELRNVPNDGWLKRVWILEKDATTDRSLRAADEVTGVAFKLTGQSEELIRSFVDAYFNRLDFGSNSQTDDTAPDFQAHAPHGIIYLDLRKHARGFSDYGLDLTGMGTDQIKLGFTITTYASGDQSCILYERLQANKFTTFN